MSEATLRYILGLVLVAVVCVAYAVSRKQGLRAIVLDALFCFGCMMAVIAAVAGVIYVLCALK